MRCFKCAILEGRESNSDGKTGDTMSWPELQTMQTTYQLITQGERPWNALGDFLNYWFGYAADRRAELVREPIQEPVEASADLHRWGLLRCLGGVFVRALRDPLSGMGLSTGLYVVRPLVHGAGC